ncbi:MAG: xanthine dehydrogenase FAD-binding subunit XdhB [Clostridiales bacterium]
MFDIADIVCPTTAAQALAAVAADPQAVVIAGGTDVLVKVREGKLAGARLISIHGLSQWQGITQDQEGTIHIGPLTTFSQLENHPLLREKLQLLTEGAGQAGGPQLREQGTIGGNICNGAPSADTAPALLCVNARLLLSSRDSCRFLPIEQFWLGPGKTALAAGELLTDILIKQEDFEGFGGCYYKYSMRQAMDIATLSCAITLRLGAEDKIAALRIALGVAAPTPMRAVETEQALEGLRYPQAAAEIGARIRREINPRDSWRASRAFRLQIAGEISARALQQAWLRAGGKVK